MENEKQKEIQDVGFIQQENKRRVSNINRTTPQHNKSFRTIKYFSMFTGTGGFELGIERANNDKFNTRTQNNNERIKPNTTTSNGRGRRTYSNGVRFKCIGFSEIDKYCNELLKNKFPTIKNYGDATKIIPKELPDFNLLVGGFPCQAFSIAGKRRGFEDTRGTLFHDIVRILEVKRPKHILLENVKGLLSHDRGRTFATILASLSKLGYVIQWMVLNSKFFGVPQNRERVFIVGSLRGEPIPEILPLGEGNEEINCKTIMDINQAQRVYGIEGTSIALKGLGGGQGAKTGLYSVQVPTNTKFGYDVAEEKEDGIRLQYEDSKTARGRVVKGSSQALQANSISGVLDNMKIRRLTPIECERLQGFPDNWTEGFSDTQRYKMMGNAVTVNVIKAIMEKLI